MTKSEYLAMIEAAKNDIGLKRAQEFYYDLAIGIGLYPDRLEHLVETLASNSSIIAQLTDPAQSGIALEWWSLMAIEYHQNHSKTIANVFIEAIAQNPNIDSNTAQRFAHNPFSRFLLQNPAMPLWVLVGMVDWKVESLHALLYSTINMRFPLRQAIYRLYLARDPEPKQAQRIAWYMQDHHTHKEREANESIFRIEE